MKHPYKKSLAVLALASMVVLSSCGAVPTNEDPTAILKDARANFVSEITSSVDKDTSGSSMLNFDGTAAASGMSATFNGTIDSKSALQNDVPASSLLFKLNAAVDAPSIGKSSGALELEIRTFAQKFYGKIVKAEAESANAQLDAQIKQGLALASLYSAKWFKLDQATLQQMSGASSAVQAINKEEIKAILAELNNYEIFTLEEKLAPANGQFVYKVRLNADGIASLVKAISAKSTPSTPMTDADMQDIKSAITAINNEKAITHTLYIDSTSKKYTKFESKGTVEKDGMKTTISSVFEAPKTEAIKWVASIDAVDTAANTTNSVKIDMSGIDGKTTGKISINIPGTSPLTADINLNGTYNKNKVSIEEPTDATDLTQMLGAMGAGATPSAAADATSTALPTSPTTTTDDAAAAAALENAMGE